MLSHCIYHLLLRLTLICCLLLIGSPSSANGQSPKISRKSYEAQLYEDLLFEYNKIARPVKNSSDVLHVDVGASLIRIIDVDEKNQVLTTNLWLEMQWNDFRLQWDPDKYGDNAAGDPDITIFTDALVSYTSRVYWQPPAIYKSYCQITVKWFPYDKQNCRMKFGIWSYTGNYVDLHLINHDEAAGMLASREGGDGAAENDGVRRRRRRQNEDGEKDTPNERMEMGMDLSFFYRSAEWDLMNLTSERHAELYSSCCGPETYVDITYYLELRRKTLFFTTNLIVPCFLISFLTTFVFYLSDHKITFSISILVTLTVFYLVLIDLMPPTSLEVPMFGQYLITTMVLVALSTMVSVITVNIRFRNGATHQMSPWIRIVFLNLLPKLLFMRRPEQPSKSELPAPLSAAGTSLASPIFPLSASNSNALSAICPTLVSSQPLPPPLIPETDDDDDDDDGGDDDAEEEEKSEKGGGRRKRPSRLLFNLNNISHGTTATVHMPFASSSFTLPAPQTLLVNNSSKMMQPPPYSASTRNAKKQQQTMGAQNCMQLPVTQLIGNGNRRQHKKLPIGGSGGTAAIDQACKQTQLLWSGAAVSNSRHRERFVGVGSLDAKMRANEIIFGNLVKQVRFIAEYFRRCEEEAEISDDWTFVAMVLDRLFLLIFSVLNMATFSIIISAPTLFDFREPLNVTVPTRPLGQANLFSIHHDYL